jgi:hypothetical protein
MNAYLKSRLDELDSISADFEREFPSLSTEQLNWKPSAKVWSIAEVFTHNLLAGGSYAPQVQQVIAQRKTYQTDKHVEVRNTTMGNLFYYLVNPATKRKIPTVKKFEPTASNIPPSIIDSYREYLATMRGNFAQFDGLDFNKPKMRPQALPFLSFTLGNYLKIETGHLRRHLNQALNVKANPNFPKA